MKKLFIFFFILLLSLSLYAEGYYHKGKFIPLKKKSLINQHKIGEQTSLSYTDNNHKTYTITNRILIKFKQTPYLQDFESKYNITLIKTLRKVYIFEVTDITNVLSIVKNIYENEEVKYAQPSFIHKVQKNNLIDHSFLKKFSTVMTPKIISHDNEDIKSMTDAENSVNYYKYYDDVFRYDDESFWQIHNKGGFEATAYYEGEFKTINAIADIDGNVLEVIDANHTGKNITIAIIDSSFSLTHPDLKFSDTYNINRKNRDITIPLYTTSSNERKV